MSGVYYQINMSYPSPLKTFGILHCKAEGKCSILIDISSHKLSLCLIDVSQNNMLAFRPFALLTASD